MCARTTASADAYQFIYASKEQGHYPADKRLTRPNAVRKQHDPLLSSGLLGPVVLQRAVSSNAH